MTDASRLTAALADRYTIERELGAGGMATVYLAHDIKHDRRVAVKVLRPELAAVIGAERFLAEIKTTANLQHPHILPLFDSGEADSFLFYVMPYVEGISLRDRMTREKQLPINEAVRIASEVAAALDYAHRHGVIHRDIKPENIMLHDGSALVADFGIALAASKAGTRMTETGMSLGTPQYMSPEQAMGERELDARSDVYALGCVTYEMLTGEPPFSGPTAQAIVAKVMTAEPAEITSLRKTVPANVADAVHTALQKLPADRFETAAQFAGALASQARVAEAYRGSRPDTARRQRAVGLALAAGALLGLLAGVALFSSRPEHLMTTGAIIHVTTDDGLEVQPAISPDGKMLAYAAGTSLHVRLYLRPVDGGRAVPLTNDSTTDQQEPQWSPSGGSILFLAGGGVDTVAVGLGWGTPATLISGKVSPGVNGVRTVSSATWSPDGRQILFVQRDSLYTYTIASGETHLVVGKYQLKECAWSAHGGHIACTTPRDYGVVTANMGNIGPSTIFVIPAAGGEAVALTDSVSLSTSPVWSPDGRRLYFISNRDRQRDIYYVNIAADGRAVGEVHRLTTALNAASLSLSADGRRLAYSVYTPQSNVWSLPILPNGVATSAMASQVTFGHQEVESLQLTPDGKGLIIDADRNGNSDIWRLRFGEREAEALTNDVADEFGGVLSPDGKRLAFYSYPHGTAQGMIMVKPMTGGGPIQQVNLKGNYGIYPEWMPDGKSLAWACGGRDSRTFCLGTQDDAGAWHVDSTSATARSNWSPDGKWRTNPKRNRAVAFADSVWLYPPGSDSGKLLYARRSTTDPTAGDVHWGPDSRTLYFRNRDPAGHALFWSLSIDRGLPRLIAKLDDLARQSYRNDFSADGKRLYFAINDRQSDISVVELIER